MPVVAGTVEPYQAGSPISNQKWLRCSLRNLKEQIGWLGSKLSVPTLARLLKKLGYSLKLNSKKVEASAKHPERDRQFKQIERLRRQFSLAGWPVISCDTKKKELIGLYKNAGAAWCQTPFEVNVHDFPGEATAKAVPYGIYDPRTKRGSVYVGDSADTPEFAVSCIAAWWQEEGRYRYAGATDLLILVDSGGSNSCRAHTWKWQLQTKLCNEYGLSVTICHYPTGCSKWNMVEHQLFGPISINWAGQPLTSFEKMLGYLNGTTNSGGLVVRAKRVSRKFETGLSVSRAEVASLNLERSEECGQWTYTLRPQVTQDTLNKTGT